MTESSIGLDSSLGAMNIADLDGIAFPAPAGDAGDFWLRLLSLKARKVTTQLIDRALSEATPTMAAGVTRARDLIDSLEPGAWCTSFSSPVAFQPLNNDVDMQGLGIEDPVSWCLALPRFLVGAPDVPSMRAVLPASVIPQGGLYLPHLHALLSHGCTHGPVAVESGPQGVRLTWVDGNVLSLPSGAEALDAFRGQSVPRMRFLPKVVRWPVLNGVPEVRAATATYWQENRGATVRANDVADGWHPGHQEQEIFEQGLALLEQVWPEAAAGVLRTIRGLVFLPHRNDGHYHSYSTVKLHGAVVASALNRVQVADVLVHECAHTRMSPLFELDPLIEDDGAAIHPSPWRADLRPLKGLVNGVQAFANVYKFYQRLPALPDWPRERSEAIVQEQGEKLRTAWKYINEHANPTPLGRLLFEDLDAFVKAL